MTTLPQAAGPRAEATTRKHACVPLGIGESPPCPPASHCGRRSSLASRPSDPPAHTARGARHAPQQRKARATIPQNPCTDPRARQTMLDLPSTDRPHHPMARPIHRRRQPLVSHNRPPTATRPRRRPARPHQPRSSTPAMQHPASTPALPALPDHLTPMVTARAQGSAVTRNQ